MIHPPKMLIFQCVKRNFLEFKNPIELAWSICDSKRVLLAPHIYEAQLSDGPPKESIHRELHSIEIVQEKAKSQQSPP